MCKRRSIDVNPSDREDTRCKREVGPTKADAKVAAVVILAFGVLMLAPITVRPAAAQGQDAQLQQATQLNAQGLTLLQQGRYPDAELQFKRSLAIREKALGPEHPLVAQSLNNLALVYQDEGRYADTEPLEKRALAVNEEALGPEHPSVALNLNNLAGT